MATTMRMKMIAAAGDIVQGALYTWDTIIRAKNLSTAQAFFFDAIDARSGWV
jgi:hypothetical protein